MATSDPPMITSRKDTKMVTFFMLSAAGNVLAGYIVYWAI